MNFWKKCDLITRNVQKSIYRLINEMTEKTKKQVPNIMALVMVA